jgi:hypothetical protein
MNYLLLLDESQNIFEELQTKMLYFIFVPVQYCKPLHYEYFFLAENIQMKMHYLQILL